jgi:hypothetical protein
MKLFEKCCLAGKMDFWQTLPGLWCGGEHHTERVRNSERERARAREREREGRRERRRGRERERQRERE